VLAANIFKDGVIACACVHVRSYLYQAKKCLLPVFVIIMSYFVHLFCVHACACASAKPTLLRVSMCLLMCKFADS